MNTFLRHFDKPVLPIGITALLILLTGCTRPPVFPDESGHAGMTQALNTTIRNSGLRPNLGVKVVSLRSGETLYAYQAGHLFTPASNTKLFTAAAALKILTPQYRFETAVWIDSAYIDSVHVPRLYLKGSGDPDLSLLDLEDLARRVGNRIQAVDTLLLDNTAMDAVKWGPGWMWDEGSAWYFAQVDALTVNDNCVDITIRPAGAGSPPIVSVNPSTNYVVIDNQALTVADTTDIRPLRIRRRWEEHSNVIEITGHLLTGDRERTTWINIEDPAAYAGRVFAGKLSARGVTVNGPSLKRAVPENGYKLAGHRSPPLTTILVNFLKNSDNLSGELLVKAIGSAATGTPGTWHNGLAAVKTFLHTTAGVDTGGIRLEDGSGISRYNLVSPEQVTRLLTYMYHDYTVNAEYLAALPTGGLDGTLQGRMHKPEFQRNLRAKTGTLSGVTALSGYAFTRDREPLAFSILMNGYVGSSAPFRQLQDEICRQLVTFSRN